MTPHDRATIGMNLMLAQRTLDATDTRMAELLRVDPRTVRRNRGRPVSHYMARRWRADAYQAGCLRALARGARRDG